MYLKKIKLIKPDENTYVKGGVLEHLTPQCWSTPKMGLTMPLVVDKQYLKPFMLTLCLSLLLCH